MPQMSLKNRVLADKNLFGMSVLLNAHGYQCNYFDGESGIASLPKAKTAADALIIRTVTKVDKVSLENLPQVKAIFSASAGVDHVDMEAVNNKNIYFDNAAGSNARAVAEYVLTAIIYILSKKKLSLIDLKVGIVGLGAVGSEVNKLLKLAGVKTILYDPPKSLREPNFKSATLSDLKQADILSFHTPLVKNGAHKTWHLFDDFNFWDRASTSLLAVINTARGGVLNEDKILALKKNEAIEFLITDVWENEPHYNVSFREQCLLATPHIAGYSLQAKLRASWQCICSLNAFFGIETIEDFNFWAEKLLSKANNTLSKSEFQAAKPASLYEHLCNYNPIQGYHNKLALLDNLSLQEKAKKFKALRVQQALRNEYAYLTFEEDLLQRYPLMRVLQSS